ncbi:uncharacterized protein C8R40DRAFT_545829 [Lentinula edodes]|uniref:uncharacterized protein n=1 Tax=Lentinula edodes TaxID=5353 RepID=UPI001E8CECD6|nr:uncharacterized protein C8R40DRAFT_545829 [Lentinula edodes]KAH7871601.1 hypothetical protein C8R40DRAFT_545829 [Lentinula edodes]
MFSVRSVSVFVILVHFCPSHVWLALIIQGWKPRGSYRDRAGLSPAVETINNAHETTDRKALHSSVLYQTR